MSNSSLPIVVIGAGPVGLAAAAHLVQRNETPLVLEAGDSVGANIQQWAHVRVFSPWEYNLDPVSRALLETQGWTPPPTDHYPTGGEIVEHYLRPLAALPEIAPNLQLNTRVTAIAREGLSRTNTAHREHTPFVVRVETNGVEREFRAKAVIDASGTFASPNPLGSSGLAALGERAHRDHIFYGIPDVLHTYRARYANKRVMVVGSGHSAFNVLLDLITLTEAEARTTITWVIRKSSLTKLFGGGADDQLPERGRLGQRLREALNQGRLIVETGFSITALKSTPEGIVVSNSTRSLAPVDEIVACTGFRPDLSLTGELRLALDEVVESPVALAPLIDPNLHSCGTVPPHGAEELKHPEADFYIVGMKSYGRAPTFLLRTGYEQVRSVVLALTGDWEGARRVELVLPETGVCNGPAGEDGAACCGTPTPKFQSLSESALVLPVLN